jgi:phosphate transport system substrate-binding protein
MTRDGKNKYRLTLAGCLLLGALFLSGCQGERKESPTKGSVTVMVSESVSPLIKAEKEKFEELYPDAHVSLVVTSAREAITHLFNDTIKVIVSSRPFNTEERDFIKRANLTIGEFKIAIDGIAVITNLENPITGLRTTQLDSLLSGSTTSWSTAGWNNAPGPVELCLPDRNSGTYEVAAAKILHGGKFAVATKVATSSPEMVQCVSERPNAIGLLGLNWLNENKEKVKVLELSDPDAPDSLGTRGKFFSPHQAYVYQQYYPLTRDIYIYSRSDGYSVGAGFLAFVNSAPGQKIVQNSGLVPATMPVRLVHMTSESPQ